MDEKSLLRAYQMVDKYKNGKTLGEIGRDFKLSRERINQLIKKALFSQIEAKVGNGEEVDVAEFERDFKEAHRINRLRMTLGDLGAKKETLLQKATAYASLSKFILKEKISLKKLEENFPEVIKKIKENSFKEKKKWSRFYARCRNCGTTLVPHAAYGLCKNCYPRSAFFKEMQKRSRERNLAKRKEWTRKYLAGYNKRPEIVAKKLYKQDLKVYGGNREKTIQRDGERCVECGMTREEARAKYGKDFFVRHVDNDKTNNNLGNLKTLCQGCFQIEPKSSS